MLARTIALLLLPAATVGVCAPLAAEELPPRWESVCFIKSIVEKEDQKTGKAASGFFVRRSSQFYLVTAQHAAADSSPSSVVAFSIGDSSVNVKLADLGLSSANGWLTKPNYDVAVLPVAHRLLSGMVCLDFEACQSELPPPKSVIEVVGFPLALGIQGVDLTPIVMEGKLASGEILDPFKKEGERIAVCIPAFADGASGSPVFAKFGQDDWRVIGVFTGNLSDSSGGKLSKIAPAHAMIDLINIDAAATKK